MHDISVKNIHRTVSNMKTLTGQIFSLILLITAVTISGCSSSSPTQNMAEWPSFHGADRTNKSNETGLLREWPEEGPELLWTFSGLGEGYSTIIVADGHIYASGLESGQTTLFCLDLQGNTVWKKANGKAWSTTLSWATTYTGARSTPTYSDGVVYHLGEAGRLAAFDAKTGEELWYKDLKTEFDAPELEYGYSESVLVEGEKLFVRPAGRDGYQVCLNKNDGSLIWANNEIPGTEGYSSMVLMDFGNHQMGIASSSNSYYGIDINTGDLLWRADFENPRGLNITDAVISDDYVFMTSGYGKGSMLVKLTSESDNIKPVTIWETDLMDNHHGGVILQDGFLYGSGSNSRGWFCLEMLTGQQRWNADGKGSITYADGMLYLLDERSGSIKLAEANPEKYIQKGEFKVPQGGEGMYWAHPVVCGGRLYIRHADKVYAYDISNNE